VVQLDCAKVSRSPLTDTNRPNPDLRGAVPPDIMSRLFRTAGWVSLVGQESFHSVTNRQEGCTMVSFSRGKLLEPMAAGLDSLPGGGEGATAAGESNEGAYGESQVHDGGFGRSDGEQGS